MITCRAPGKLFIAGEYAVVEPGQPAVLMAVDRYAKVTLTVSDGESTVTSDLLGDKVFRFQCTDGRVALRDADAPNEAALSYVAAAVIVVERVVRERGGSPRDFHLEINGADFTAEDGRKLGLGSSAAVTVAVVAALVRFYELPTTLMGRYRLAMLATAAVDTRCSGGDVAAATWGGWIAYTMPDRQWLHTVAIPAAADETLSADWPGLSIRRLPPPTGLQVQVGWTALPAASAALVTKYTEQTTNTAYRQTFLAGSAACVRHLIDGLDHGDLTAVKHQIRSARTLLSELDNAMGLGIMTPGLRTLCAVAEDLGAAAKPSGAGGGDCGIALMEPDSAAAVDRLRHR